MVDVQGPVAVTGLKAGMRVVLTIEVIAGVGPDLGEVGRQLDEATEEFRSVVRQETDKEG